jgi:hypothetical protein
MRVSVVGVRILEWEMQEECRMGADIESQVVVVAVLVVVHSLVLGSGTQFDELAASAADFRIDCSVD